MSETPPDPPDPIEALLNSVEGESSQVEVKSRLNAETGAIEVRHPGEDWRALNPDEQDGYMDLDDWKRLHPGETPSPDEFPINYVPWNEEDERLEQQPQVDAAKDALRLEAAALRGTNSITEENLTDITEKLAAAATLEEVAAVHERLAAFERAAARAAGGGAAAGGAGGGRGGGAGAGAGGAGTPPDAPRRPDGRRLTAKEIGEERAAYEHTKKELERARVEAEKVAALQAQKDKLLTRFEALRAAKVITDEFAMDMIRDIEAAKSVEALNADAAGKADYYEKQLPDKPERPANSRKRSYESSPEVRARAQLAADEVRDAILAGINPDIAYLNRRMSLRVGDLNLFDSMLQEHERTLGAPLGITYGSTTPADRLRNVVQPPPIPPAWEGNYLAETDGSRNWFDHDSKKYGDLKPFSLEAIRTDPFKQQLFGEFKAAVDPSRDIYETIADNKPLDDAQRKFLEYCQFEFTYQFNRAERLREALTPETLERLAENSPFLKSTLVMMGTEKLHEFFQKDLFHLAVQNRGMFDRYEQAANYSHDDGFKGWFERYATKDHSDTMQTNMARILAKRLKVREVRQKMEKHAATGEPMVLSTAGGAQNVEQMTMYRDSMRRELSDGQMQEIFDRDSKNYQTPDGKKWVNMNESERTNYRDNVWNPPEARKHKEGEGKGFWAGIARALAEMFFKEQKKKVSVHK